jgi:hypothetical protein
MEKSTTLKEFYPDTNDRNQVIGSHTIILDDGRYQNLDPEILGAYIATPLGFGITYHQPYAPDQAVGLHGDCIYSIDLYHDGDKSSGHWEPR